MTLLLTMPGGTEWMLIFLFLAAWIIPLVFYLMTLQSTLNTISERNRKMQSGLVWLLLIPLFAFVWHFFVIRKVADSISAEANAMDLQLDEPSPAYNIGLAMCIINCLILVPNGTIKMLVSIGALVCWVIYWVKISNYKKILKIEKMILIGAAN